MSSLQRLVANANGDLSNRNRRENKDLDCFLSQILRPGLVGHWLVKGSPETLESRGCSANILLTFQRLKPDKS
jgi:hypothetical protein